MDQQDPTNESPILVESQMPEGIVGRAAISSVPPALAVPCQIVLLGVGLMPNWEFVEPLTLTIERDDDQSFVASDDTFNMYGIGDTVAESVNDYFKVLSEYYRHLSADEDEASVALFTTYCTRGRDDYYKRVRESPFPTWPSYVTDRLRK